LEETAADVQEFCHAVARFHARLANVVGAEQGDAAVLAKAQAEFEAEHREFFDAFRLLTHSESRLLLLGERKCGSRLTELGDEVRAQFASIHGFREFSSEELEQGRLVRRDKRDAFFQELSNAYLRSAP
jgi:hypothetical protein